MRVSLLIDDELLAAAFEATGLRDTREVVELALRTLLRLRQQAEVQALRSKITWECDLDATKQDK